jgi:hypothetical protein
MVEVEWLSCKRREGQVTPSPDKAFQRAIRERVQPFLKLKGFSKKDGTFRRTLGVVVHVVTFQKSGKSTADEITFAANLGVASCRLLERGGETPAAVGVEGCHWRRRLVREGTTETWWNVCDEATAARSGDEVAGALRIQGLPSMEHLCDDRALRDLWISGDSPGLTDVQRLVNLTVLLQSLGPAAELSAVLGKIKQMVIANPLPILLTTLREAGEPL